MVRPISVIGTVVIAFALLAPLISIEAQPAWVITAPDGYELIATPLNETCTVLVQSDRPIQDVLVSFELNEDIPVYTRSNETGQASFIPSKPGILVISAYENRRVRTIAEVWVLEPDEVAPGRIQGVTANPIGEGRIIVTWRQNLEADLDHYIVYVNGRPYETKDTYLISRHYRWLATQEPAAPNLFTVQVSAVDIFGNEGMCSMVTSCVATP